MSVDAAANVLKEVGGLLHFFAYNLIDTGVINRSIQIVLLYGRGGIGKNEAHINGVVAAHYALLRQAAVKSVELKLMKGYLYHLGVFLLEIHSLHAFADTCEYLVGNGLQDIAQHSYWEVVAKYLNAVALVARNVRDINHAHIHTDISHIVSLLPIDKAIAMAITQVAVETVSIANGDGSNAAGAHDSSLPTVTYRITWRNVANLQDSSFQRRQIMDDVVIDRVDAVQAQSEAAHIKVALRETLDTRRIADMA